MSSYRDLLQKTKTEIAEIAPAEAAALPDGPLFLDVRERDEWEEGHIPGALHIPRGTLESRVEAALPDRERPVVVYCAGGARSAFAAKTLEELGYGDIRSLAGGYTDWKRNGFPTQLPRSLDAAKRSRYSRHILIPEVGEEGQLKLLDARVLLSEPAAWVRPPRSTSRRRESAGSASWTPTWSTSPTSSARSSTRPRPSASSKCFLQRRRSRR